jgi:transcriptional regulator with XRE-family HTH domain
MSHQNARALADAVLHARATQGLSVQAIAAKAQVNRTTWTNVEQATRTVLNARTLGAIDVALDWPFGTARSLLFTGRCLDGSMMPNAVPVAEGRPAETDPAAEPLRRVVRAQVDALRTADLPLVVEFLARLNEDQR